MPKSILQKIDQRRCPHDGEVERDCSEANIHNGDRLSLRITCQECGKEGWDWWEYQEREWK